MFKYSVLIGLFILLSSCATTPVKPVVYQGTLPIYPAVVEVLSEKQTKVEAIDIFKDTVLSDYINVVDLLVPYRFKVEMKRDNGFIQARSVNMQLQDSKTGLWSDNPYTLAFDINQFLNDMTNNVLLILGDPHKYSISKSKAINDLMFIHLVMKDFTDVARDRWVTENLINQELNINLPLSGFKRNNNKEIKKAYTATFDYKKDGAILHDLIISYYTDNDRYSISKLGESIVAKGTIIAVDKIIDRRTFEISLIEK